jgi:hypothetical protein
MRLWLMVEVQGAEARGLQITGRCQPHAEAALTLKETTPCLLEGCWILLVAQT